MAGGNIGDVFLRVLAEMSGFEATVTKGADQAGQKAGQSLSKSIGASLKANAGRALLGGLSAAAGIATKGLLELENVVADFRAETGATAQEAEQAGRAINAMAGRNIQPLAEVGQTLAKVHTDLGLTGEAAEAAAESFLKYGRATGRDATEGVAALDDILDAWNLDASKAQGIMDKLIASHQKYGGSISENEKALGELAPQLQALGATTDDGIALLNLFAASGLDASKATFALNTAVRKLKPGQNLDDLVAQVSAIEDPTLRAQKAIEIFGSRGGVSLANALRPGIDSLADFGVSADEATGATQEAADALDSTFGSRFKLLMKGAGAALVGFGSNFGPALTGMASLLSLAGSLGGGKLASGIASLGLSIGKRLGKALLATSVVSAVADGLGGALGKVGKSGALTKATGKLGDLMGSKLGKGLSVAFAAVAIFEVFQTYDRISKELAEQGRAIGEDIGKQIATGSVDSLQQSKAALEQGLRDINGVWDAGLFTTENRRNLEAQLAAVNAAIAQRTAEIPGVIGDKLADGASAVATGATAMLGGLSGTDAANAKAAGYGKTLANSAVRGFYDGVVAKQSVVGEAFQTFLTASEQTMDKAGEIAYLTGVLTSTELANGLTDKRDNVRAAAEETRRLAEERLNTLKPNASNIGKDTNKALAEGLKSKDPDVRAQARRTKSIIETNIKANTRPKGRQAGQGVIDGLNDKKGAAARAAAAFAKSIIGGVIEGIRSYGQGSSVAIGGNYARASGGPVTGHQTYLVGESGPELFVPSVTGTVIPNLQTQRIMASGSDSTTINLSLTGAPLQAQSPADVVRELRRASRLGLTPPRRVKAFAR